uniref:Kinesin motor domain-containing protein n=1 Tax=Panagrolaimus sp. JU765 TaxID=591449 RepID=A0AC34R4N9_9BILA
MSSGDNKENVSVRTPKQKARSESASNRTGSSILPSNIRTFLRIRGGCNSGDEVATMDVVKNGKGKEAFRFRGSQFEFDKIFVTNVSQTEVYKSVVGDAVGRCLQGYNYCILAYGQTGSGKTHSISGNDSNPGILPQFCEDLFRGIEEREASEQVYVSISFFEVYNEKVFDLLAKERCSLRVRGGDDVQIIGLKEIGVANLKEMSEWRRIGLQHRATAATLINELSSRSHAIFRITIRREFVQKKRITVSHCHLVDLAGSEKITVSHCHLVDLAGSEKLHPTNVRHQIETLNINKSLLALQQVVEIRASGTAFVNYRDSVLTRVLRSSFAGNCITAILATISPLEKFSNETLSTLRFVTRAARIEQTPVANEDKETEEISQLKAENAAFKKELQELQSLLESMKNVAVEDCPKAPCIVWLHDDASLNMWKGLENGLKVEDFLENKVLEVNQENDRWMVKSIFEKEVFLNGKELEYGKLYQIKHGDGIVIEGQVFMAVYLEANANLKNFRTYSDVKFQYVTERFEIEKQKLRQEALDDLKKEDSEVKIQMQQELEQLRSELEDLRKREKNAVGNKRKSLTQQREEAERVYQDINEMHRNVELQVNQAIQKYSTKPEPATETAEEKEKLLQKKARVEMLNLMLEKANKSAAFIFRVQNINDEQKVRLFNKKYKLYSDINDDDFNNMYETFADAYQSAMSKDEIIGVVERHIYSGTMIWKNVRGPNSHSSSLFQIAVMNSVQDTAWKRKSTVADVQKTLKSRKSVLMQHVGAQNEKAEGIDTELFSYLSLYIIEYKADLSIPEAENEIARFFDMILEAKEHFHVFSNAETFVNASTIQKKAFSWTQLHRSIMVVEKMKAGAAFLSSTRCSVDAGIDYLYTSIYERSQCIRNAMDAWVNCCREGVSSAEHINLIETELASIVETFGRIGFILDVRLLPRHRDFENSFKKGVDGMIEEYCDDLEEGRKGGLSTRKRIQQIIVNIIDSLRSSVASAKGFQQDLTFDLVRQAIFIKERMRTSTDDKMVRMVSTLKSMVAEAKKYDSMVEYSKLEKYLADFSLLANAAVKPPISLL